MSIASALLATKLFLRDIREADEEYKTLLNNAREVESILPTYFQIVAGIDLDDTAVIHALNLSCNLLNRMARSRNMKVKKDSNILRAGIILYEFSAKSSTLVVCL